MTHLIKMVVKEIETQDPHALIVTMAFTHRAARIAGGSTVAHCLHKYRDAHNAWGIVDEFSQLTTDLLHQISRWKWWDGASCSSETRVASSFHLRTAGER